MQMEIMENKNPVKKEDAFPTGQAVVVVDATAPGAGKRVGGRLLAERIVIECNRAGLEEVYLVVPEIEILNDFLPDAKNSLSRQRIIESRGNIAKAIFRAKIVGKNFIYVNAGYLIDPRLIKFLMSASPSCYFGISGSSLEPVAGIFTRDDLFLWAVGSFGEVLNKSRALSFDVIERYNPEIRGEQAPYVVKVETNWDAAKATWTLITRNQKKVMDLPSKYIDPPFENFLTFVLCYTRVTPNQVTIFNLLVAFIVGCLFWSGHFVSGAFLTYAAEILDGVDGKLARAKIIFSKLGEYECYIDFLYEHWWYVAIAVGLKHAGYNEIVWPTWGLLALSDIWDNILYTFSEHWYGRSLDLLSSFDEWFRNIAGRRNIYALIFLIGFLLGRPLETFQVAALWAFITATIHTYRLARHRLEHPVSARSQVTE